MTNGLLRLHALRDVAKAPHPSDDVAGQPPGLRETLEHAAVLKAKTIAALRVGLGVELLYFRDELIGLFQLVDHERQRFAVISRFQDRTGDPPHIREFGVEALYSAVRCHYENSVGG